MPIVMDRHDLPDITAEDVAQAHKRDLEVQDQFNCRALTYWFDKERRTAFCLFEAPEIQAVKELHKHSHGMVPGNIIEVDGSLVKTFLGRIHYPEDSAHTGEGTVVVREPAFRTIMVIHLHNAAILKYNFGDRGFYNYLRRWKDVVEETAQKYGGKVQTDDEDTWIASFSTTSCAVDCALEVKDRSSDLSHPSDKTDARQWSISLTAGNPVTEKKGFFKEAIHLAKCLCRAADSGQIAASSRVNNLYKKEELKDLSDHQDIMTFHAEDEQFLARLGEALENLWNKENLTNSLITKELGMSESQFYRKISSLTGSTPTEFIQESRLRRAVRLIENDAGNISQIAFETGFNNPSYFSKCFRNYFGFLPSSYRDIVS
ncbi:MAG: DUF4242 domain-containing protein [Candidatus Marinimicrobia bacterium]|nr:DUF4242 domain-containing protein [Candidatus Neomarinimicrobiota bacterium]MCF7830265.1 DUF4242 domain-containing protein [Candidatus Neomarinimicrobiota bacterium]MCF7882174.1 DUF4242 domain-containing protein [Candidatus Neomarinimicrobiota bacterium]